MKFGARSADSLTDFDQSKAKQAQLPASRVLTPPIPTQRWIRNSRHPNAALESMKGEAANVAGMMRPKEVFRSLQGLGAIGTTTRWRHAWHSGPYTSFLCVRVLGLSVPNTTTAASTRFDITDVAGNVLQTVSFVWGSNGLAVDAWIISPETATQFTKYLEINPDTDYYGVWTDTAGAAIQAACVSEVSSLTENFDGYIPQNFVATGPILGAYRRNLAEFTRAMWKRGGAHVLNWTVNDGTAGVTTTSSTPTNIFDGTGTVPLWGPANSPSSPGYILDMTGKARRSQQTTGVPVVMTVFGSSSGATGGRVYLKDSTGATVMSIIDAWAAASPAGWRTVAGFLPARCEKYDLQIATPSGTFSLYAASIYEYEA